MDGVQKGASALWRVALAALLGVLTWQAYSLRHAPAWVQGQLQREADATRKAAQAAIEQQGDATRKAALKAIADNLKPVLAEVKGWRRDTGAQVAALRTALLGPEDSLRADVMARVDNIQGALLDPKTGLRADILARVDQGIHGVQGTVKPLAQSTGRVLDAAAEQADLLGRCATVDPDTGEVIGNVDCLANRLIPAMKAGERAAGSVERMAKAVEKETPETAKAVRKTSQDLATIADRLARPVSWIKGLLTTAAKAVGKYFGY